MPNRRFTIVAHILALVLVSLCVYANNFDHEYLLDSGSGLKDNHWVRSLANIPAYFKDPLTLTQTRANGDYRPILQITYALNYQISGYQMWSWHLVQILLHAGCAIGLYAFCRRILVEFFQTNVDADEHWLTVHIPFLAVLIFLVHPTQAGVVNYLWARSSLLVATFLLPSFVSYMNPDRRDRMPWLAFLLYALALFTKVEAVAALGFYVLYEVMQTARQRLSSGAEQRGGFVVDVIRTLLQRRIWQRIWPFLVVTIAYAVIRNIVVEPFIAEARKATDMTSWTYLLTQVTALWHYVGQWFAPINLIADNSSYTTFKSLADPVVIVSLVGWALVATIVTLLYRRRRPVYMFLTMSALALISPTSSFMPLAEMVNEHRPYLPMALFSLAWLLPLFLALRRLRKPVLPICIAVYLALVAGVGAMTWHRNHAYSTFKAYWKDVVDKAPSARSLLNYGWALHNPTDGSPRDPKSARDYYERSLKIAPHWHITLINLALACEQTGEPGRARKHLDHAVTCDLYSSDALYFRATFMIRQKEYAAALTDLQNGYDKAQDEFKFCEMMAVAYAGLLNHKECLAMTRKCLQIDARRLEQRAVRDAIVTPYWNSKEAHGVGLRYLMALDGVLPERWWVHDYMAQLLELLGQKDVAAKARQRAAQLKARRDKKL